MSRDGSDSLWLLRLLQKDSAAVEWCRRRGPELVGTLLDVELVGYIDLAPVARRVIPPAPVENYIRAIGRKAYFAAVDSIRSRQAADGSPLTDALPLPLPSAQILELKTG